MGRGGKVRCAADSGAGGAGPTADRLFSFAACLPTCRAPTTAAIVLATGLSLRCAAVGLFGFRRMGALLDAGIEIAATTVLLAARGAILSLLLLPRDAEAEDGPCLALRWYASGKSSASTLPLQGSASL